MLVSELNQGWPNALLSQSPIWNRRIDRLQPIDLDAFIRSYYGTPQYHQAIREVSALIDQSWNATLQRKVEAAKIIFYDPIPRQRITVDELKEWLSSTSVMRRKAILFGLETRLPIQDVVSLTWKRLYATPFSAYARAITDSCVRHLRLDYVFWENTNDIIAAPLFNLADTALEVSQGLGYSALQRLYRECLPFDQKDDLNVFMGAFNETFNEEISK